MVRAISILGCTGSIGRQTIAVAEHINMPVAALTANRKIDLLEEQARRLHPKFVAVYDEKAAKQFKIAVADTDIRVGSGMEGLIEAATLAESDCVVTAVSGSVGLRPTLAAIDEKKRIALANKETLVCAGDIVMARAAEKGAEIVPVDSEHSAIFQCLMGRKKGELRKILLTGSGGPFRGRERRELENVTEFMVNMMGPNGILDTGTLPRELRYAQPARQTQQAETACREQASAPEGTIIPLKELERREIRRAIAKYGMTTQGKKAAAKELGIGLATLYRKLEETEMQFSL